MSQRAQRLTEIAGAKSPRSIRQFKYRRNLLGYPTLLRARFDLDLLWIRSTRRSYYLRRKSCLVEF